MILVTFSDQKSSTDWKLSLVASIALAASIKTVFLIEQKTLTKIILVKENELKCFNFWGDSKRFPKYCYWLKIGFVVGLKITTEKLVSVCKSVLYGSLLMSISILKGTIAQRPSSSKQRLDRSFPYTRSLLLSTSGGTQAGRADVIFQH